MDIKVLLAVCVALVALQLCSAQPVKRSCACGLRGTDACSCIPVPSIRPKARAPSSGLQRVVYQKFAAPSLNPVGDICTCNPGGLIQPADVPSVPCKVHPKPCDTPNSYPIGDDCDGPVNPCEDSPVQSRVTTYTIPAKEEEVVEEMVPEPIRSNRGPIPADAVSMAIAYDMATRQNKKIKEGVLNFGPLQKPVDGFIKVKKTYVPEAGLHQLRNEVVELRVPSGFGKTCDDEAEASLLAAQDSCNEGEDNTGFNGRLLSYSDLGFTSVKKPCNFVQGSFAPSVPVVQTVEYVVPAERASPSGPGYTACDALGTVERGRGPSGYDGVEVSEPVYEDEECAPEEEESSLSYSGPGYVVPAAPVPAAVRAAPRAGHHGHAHSRTCSCGRKGY